jgi:hypothetical protein
VKIGYNSNRRLVLIKLEVNTMTEVTFELKEQALDSVGSKEELDALLQSAMEILERLAADGASVEVFHGLDTIRLNKKPRFVVPVDMDWQVAGVAYVLLVDGWGDYKRISAAWGLPEDQGFHVPVAELLSGARRVFGMNRETLYRFLGFNEAFIHPELQKSETEQPALEPEPKPTHTTIVRRFDRTTQKWRKYKIDWRAVNGGDLVELAKDLQELGCDALECDKDPCNRGISFRDFLQVRGRCPKCKSTRFVVVDFATTIKQFQSLIVGGL